MSARKLKLTIPSYLLLMFCLLLIGHSPALAHGVDLKAAPAEVVVVTGTYSDGEPMSFAKVKVLNPEDKTHQVGNTDAGGRFAFVAERPGKWLAILEDGMGHRGEIAWQQKPAATEQGASAAPGQTPDQAVSASKWERAAWGLSLLFWLSGLVFWRKGFKQARNV